MWGVWDYGTDAVDHQWQIGGGLANQMSGGGGGGFNWRAALPTLGAALMDAAAIMQERPATQLRTLRENQLRRDALSFKVREAEREAEQEAERRRRMQEIMDRLYPGGQPPAAGTTPIPPPAQPIDVTSQGPRAPFVDPLGEVATPPVGVGGGPAVGPYGPEPQLVPTQEMPVGGGPPSYVGGRLEVMTNQPQMPADLAMVQQGMPPVLAEKEARAVQLERAAAEMDSLGLGTQANALRTQAERTRQITPYDYARMTPGGRQSFRAFRQAGAPSTTVKVNTAATPEDALVASDREYRAELLAEAREGARTGIDQSQLGQRLKYQVLNNPVGGKWAPLLSNVAGYIGGDRMLEAIYGKGANLAGVELFSADAGRSVMNWIAETKGTITDAEMKYFREELSPNIGNTREANYIMAELMHRAGVREQNKYQALRHYITQVNPSGIGFRKWYLENPDARAWNPWAGQDFAGSEVAKIKEEYDRAQGQGKGRVLGEIED